MKEPLLSVIVPIYNVKPYLNKCIDSIINQTYDKLEIILVDDGSNDGSEQICDEYALMDNRVIVIHKKNGGISSARNIGIEAAKGEWIAFVDSDDWIDMYMYEKLVNLAIKEEADICNCLCKEYIDERTAKDVCFSGESYVLSNEQIIDGLLRQKIRFEVWNKIWKRSLIENVRFKENQLCEEVYFDRILFMKANKMACIDIPLYNYLLNRPGNTRTIFREKRLALLEEFDEFIKVLSDLNMYDSAKKIACIGTGYAISFYIDALESKQEDNILNYIKNKFKYYYKFTKKCYSYRTLRGNVVVRMFNYMPGILVRIKGKRKRKTV